MSVTDKSTYADALLAYERASKSFSDLNFMTLDAQAPTAAWHLWRWTRSLAKAKEEASTKVKPKLRTVHGRALGALVGFEAEASKDMAKAKAQEKARAEAKANKAQARKEVERNEVSKERIEATM